MKVRIFLHTFLFVFVTVSHAVLAGATSFPFRPEAVKPVVYTAPQLPASSETCHPVSGIELEFTGEGTGLITWNAIQDDLQYTVNVVAEDGDILLETVVNGNQIEVSGLIPGVEYTITICYTCPANGEQICADRKCRYVIIEDVIVMLDSKSCNCGSAPLISGTCSSTGASLYNLINSKVYHIELLDGSRMNFMVYGGKVNPVGSCVSNFAGLNQEYHLGPGFTTKYYKLGPNSKIFFHGSQFCVSGSAVGSISYCNIYWPIEPNKFKSAPTASGSVYPNPFTDVINVEITSGKSENSKAVIQLFDARGQRILEETRSDLPSNSSIIQINAGNTVPGIYWLAIKQDGEADLIIKLVKLE